MKGSGTSVTPIIAGLRTDFENLLSKFVEHPNVRYEHFSTCFRDMKLYAIFEGRQSEVELREFSEKALILALSFCFDPYSFQCRIGGLYLVYALYYTQPKQYSVKIRTTLSGWSGLLELFETLKSQHHYDACYVFHKLVRDHAFLFCAYQDEHNPLTYHRFENQHDTVERCAAAAGVLKSEFPPLQELFDNNVFEQLSTVHENYYRLKCSLAGEGAVEPQKALSLVVDNPANMILDVIETCRAKIEGREPEVSSHRNDPFDVDRHHELLSKKTEESRDLKDRRSSIKDKAYSSITSQGRSRRHRQPQDSDPSSSKSDTIPEEGVLVKSPGKSARKGRIEPAPKKTKAKEIKEPCIGELTEEDTQEAHCSRNSGPGKRNSTSKKLSMRGAHTSKGSDSNETGTESAELPEKLVQEANLKSPKRKTGPKKRASTKDTPVDKKDSESLPKSRRTSGRMKQKR